MPEVRNFRNFYRIITVCLLKKFKAFIIFLKKYRGIIRLTGKIEPQRSLFPAAAWGPVGPL